MNKKIASVVAIITLLLSSCAAPNVSYFNDMDSGQRAEVNVSEGIRLRPEDKISIVVKSKDPQLSDLFNLPIAAHRVGYPQGYSSSQEVSVYTVDSKGNIDFPIVGNIHVAGLSRESVAEVVKSELVKKDLVKDPVITVEYANLGFNVMGEVSRPGRYTFDRDHLTILDAISMAGDLTIQGRRNNVLVMRENGKERQSYRVNLQSGSELLQSPVYYLQQNDVIYVEPNDFRARQTTVNGNNVLSASFWISVASLLTSISVLLVK